MDVRCFCQKLSGLMMTTQCTSAQKCSCKIFNMFFTLFMLLPLPRISISMLNLNDFADSLQYIYRERETKRKLGRAKLHCELCLFCATVCEHFIIVYEQFYVWCVCVLYWYIVLCSANGNYARMTLRFATDAAHCNAQISKCRPRPAPPHSPQPFWWICVSTFDTYKNKKNIKIILVSKAIWQGGFHNKQHQTTNIAIFGFARNISE